METELEVDDSWKRMTIRGPKRTEGKIKLRENELMNSKEQTLVVTNCYTVLETDSNMPGNGNRMKIVYENKPRAINNRQNEI